MIIQTEPNFEVLKREFEKGNIYNLAKKKRTGEDVNIAIIKDTKYESILYDLYDAEKDYTLNHLRVVERCEDWRWDICDYCILTPEEARPYLQKIMLATLEK